MTNNFFFTIPKDYIYLNAIFKESFTPAAEYILLSNEQNNAKEVTHIKEYFSVHSPKDRTYNPLENCSTHFLFDFSK